MEYSFMRKLTRPQMEALKMVYDRIVSDVPANEPGQRLPYLKFRRSVQYAGYDSCIMVQFHNMWLGIETDGYTHS